MPYSYQIDVERQLIDIRLKGSVTGEVLVEALQTVVNDPVWQPSFARLWDFSDVTELVLSPDDIAHFRMVLEGERYRTSRTAMVVHRHVEYVAAQFARATLRNWPVQVFWSREEAEAWLESR